MNGSVRIAVAIKSADDFHRSILSVADAVAKTDASVARFARFAREHTSGGFVVHTDADGITRRSWRP